ncbi:hypothetical protein NQ318_012194 [Aromia moschata]|uniref:DUF4817 domain-containing protein n=1 Tax=Aromia moschata TaxID=1265417 RepID=A0AAV8Z1E2_9CUCU|nr:hypothetical protein NQ318_012194 [Aromia moschata]
MEKYTLEQRSRIVQFYYENQHSIILTQRAHRNLFNVQKRAKAPTMYRLVQRFQEQGAIHDLPLSGRPRSVRTEENIVRLQESIEETHETSTRRRYQQLRMSRRSLQNFFTAVTLVSLQDSVGIRLQSTSKNAVTPSDPSPSSPMSVRLIYKPINPSRSGSPGLDRLRGPQSPPRRPDLHEIEVRVPSHRSPPRLLPSLAPRKP